MTRSATLASSYSYDAFGARIAPTPATTGRYGYTGGEIDTETGLVYLRARYYDPTLGRFISPDPFLGRLAEPITQNRYVYVKNNPLGLVDPSGLAAAQRWETQSRPVPLDWNWMHQDIGSYINNNSAPIADSLKGASQTALLAVGANAAFGETEWVFLMGVLSTGFSVLEQMVRPDLGDAVKGTMTSVASQIAGSKLPPGMGELFEFSLNSVGDSSFAKPPVHQLFPQKGDVIGVCPIR